MTAKAKILVVEDEAAIRSGLLDVLTYHGFDAQGVEDGAQGLSQALSGQFDLILLDVMLPTMNGFDVCNAIREQDRQQPIIMLTAKNSDEDIIHGLTLGADDYVGKPFSVTQLVLRIKAVLRRTAGLTPEAPSHLECADGLIIDLANLSGMRGDQSIAFTQREIAMLVCMAGSHQRPVSRDQLLHQVWGYAEGVELDTRTVDIHIAKLRRKIEADHKNPVNLVTVRGAGYRLNLGKGDHG